jgi:hypothetical protein
MRRTVAGLLGLSLLVAAAGALPVAAQDAEGTPSPSAVAPAAAAGRTNVRFFVPFGPDGLNPGLRVARETTGSCGERSLADFGRDDAWFCFEAGTNGVLDPCFANPFGDPDAGAQHACAADPFSGEVTLLTTSEPLRVGKDDEAAPIAEPGATGRGHRHRIREHARSGGAVSAEEAIDPMSLPWALELADGQRCGLATGATTVMAGMRANYACEGGGWIIGELDRSQLVWTASFWDGDGYATTLVDVAAVWT